MAGREDFRQRLTNALIESIEENDGLPWEKGWDNMATRPFNPGTGIKYRGGNVINLMLEQLRRGSDDPRWMTLKQANSAGYSVRKGAKASYVEYWDWGQPQAPRKAEVDEKGNPLPRNDADTDDEEEEAQRRKPRVFFATVFNGDDIVGLPEIKREISWQPNDLAEKLIAATGAEIEHAAVSRVGFGVIENAAYYTHGRDKIVVPPRESFKSEGDYYATVLHELSHWTGHHSRLARRAPDEKRPFGSPEYAQEELRAEIASMFLTSMLGVEGKLHNHAKYTGHWLETLKGDKHEIFRAARDAEKIVDHVFEYAPELREVVESRMADNLLPKEPPKRKFDSGISPDMPNFIPPEVQAQVRTGRDDPRWAAFDQTVRGEAHKFGVEDAVVDKALGLIEPQFTEVMDAAKKNGYTAEDMNTMLARSIIDEMRTADVRQQQWERFCEQVRHAGTDLYPVEQIEVALQELGVRYQQLIAQSTQEGWAKQQTETQIRAMIYGEEGRRAITGEYVKTLVENSAAARQLVAGVESDDDFVLTPLGLSDAMPEDSGAVADEHIKGAERYIMDDAEVQMSAP
ncbi:MAG: DUF1738 domain-containing protein [Propionivibrio sp.]|nr:DUF1738 domain-containing protein [Propionivibrio sp.]